MTLGHHESNSFSGNMHYSFDFAQQIHLPYDSQQVGPMYFLTGYKIGLFGVACEPLGKFVLYILPESCVCGKGANTVVSLLHHFFENFAIGEETAELHADNCAGQNKNNILIRYLMWRVITGKNSCCKISFLPTGHTKFQPDLYFGCFKRTFRRSSCATISDVLDVAQRSCPSTNAIVPVPVGSESGHVHIPTFDWQSKFNNMNMKNIPNLSMVHHIEISKEFSGYVRTKRSLHSEVVDFNMLSCNIPSDFGNMPEIIRPSGLSHDRQAYLYDKIRRFVPKDKKDILCPRPSNRDAEDDRPSTPPPSTSGEGNRTPSKQKRKPPTPRKLSPRKRARPTCGYCKKIGHRDQTIKGCVICPKRKAEEEIRNKHSV